MNIDSALIILLAEALLAVLVVALIAFWFGRRKNQKEQEAVNDLINKLFANGENRAEELTELIKANMAGISDQDLSALLTEISEQERTLYQKIIEIFIKRDCDELVHIDSCIKDMTVSYGKIGNSANVELPPGITDENGQPVRIEDYAEELKAAQERISQYKLETERISEQLGVAMNSMDEISAEYTRMFSSEKSVAELESSRQRMLRIFATAEHKIHDALKAGGLRIPMGELTEENSRTD